MGNSVSSQQTGKLRLADSNRHSTPRSQEQDLPSTGEGCRTKFYDVYRHEAEEYDRDFIKKHDEDLNTTLIFVGSVCSSHVDLLTQHTGWSVLRRDLRIHHPGPTPTPTGPEQ